jgi:hypothetical protein
VPFPDLLEGNPAPTICASMHIALERHHISTMQIIFYNPWPFHMQSFWDSWTPFSWCTVASFSECVARDYHLYRFARSCMVLFSSSAWTYFFTLLCYLEQNVILFCFKWVLAFWRHL